MCWEIAAGCARSFTARSHFREQETQPSPAVTQLGAISSPASALSKLPLPRSTALPAAQRDGDGAKPDPKPFCRSCSETGRPRSAARGFARATSHRQIPNPQITAKRGEIELWGTR